MRKRGERLPAKKLMNVVPQESGGNCVEEDYRSMFKSNIFFLPNWQ